MNKMFMGTSSGQQNCMAFAGDFRELTTNCIDALTTQKVP